MIDELTNPYRMTTGTVLYVHTMYYYGVPVACSLLRTVICTGSRVLFHDQAAHSRIGRAVSKLKTLFKLQRMKKNHVLRKLKIQIENDE